MESTASWARAHQRAGDALGQCIHHFAHAGRGCALGAVDGQKCLHQCDGNLGCFERDHRAIAPNDLVVALRIGCCVGSVACGLFRGRVRGGRGVQSSLHGCPLCGLAGEKWQQVGAAAKARRVQPFLVVAHYIWCVDRVQDTTGSVMPWRGECSKPVAQEPLRRNEWQPSPLDRKVWRVKCCGCAGCRGICPAGARTAWMEVSKGRDPTLNLPLCFNLKRGRVYLGVA